MPGTGSIRAVYRRNGGLLVMDVTDHSESSSISRLVSHFSSITGTCAASGFTAKDLVIRRHGAYANHVQEILLVHMPVRLQGTHEAAASLVHPADLRLSPRTAGNAKVIKVWQRYGVRHLAGL